MFSIQPISDGSKNEELTSIRVLARIRHRQYSGRVVFEFEILIRKFISVNRFATRSVSLGEVATLKIRFIG